MNRRLVALLLVLGGWSGCATRVADQESSSTTSLATTAGSTSGAEGNGDVETLLVDAVAPRICQSLRGSFVGLPGEGGSNGIDAGTDPTVGRLWFRECAAEVNHDMLSLSIAGTGWTWVDRESMGFRVRQYLRFDASAAFHSRIEVGYDRETGIATIWLHPQGDVTANVEPRGLIETEATNPVSGVLGSLLELAGSSAASQAQQTVAEEGSLRLREQFASGFTVTFAMTNDQMDFMVGALPRGVVPARPYPAEHGVIWSVNQRMKIWPGGLDIIGPIAETQGLQALDLDLEEGEGISVEAICATSFEHYYDQLLNGIPGALPRGVPVVVSSHIGAHRALIPQLGCETHLLVLPQPDARVPVRMRVRLTSAAAPTETARAQASTQTEGTTRTTTSVAGVPVRLRISGISIPELNPTTEADWDVFGGQPDPYVIVISIPAQREIARTTVMADQHDAAFGLALPGAFRPDDLPLRFSVYDDDTLSDELVGHADLEAIHLQDIAPTAPTELRLQLRSSEVVPRLMGTLRISAEPIR